MPDLRAFRGISPFRSWMSGHPVLAAVVIVVAVAVGARALAQAPLKIVVLEGEDGVNVIDQKTAVAPIVEVRDRNDLPIAGAVVTFLLTGSVKTALLNNGLQTVTMTTNALGRATVTVNPLATGSLQIQISATYQGQTIGMTITQNNFATAAQALAAGKTPGASTSASSSGAGGAGGGAAGGGAAGGASTASTAAAAGGGAAGGGGMGVGSILAATAAGVGGVAGIKAAADAASGPSCSAEQSAVDNQTNSFVNSINTFTSCVNNARTNAQSDACFNQYLRDFQSFLNTLSAWCTCMGPSVSSEITAQDKAYIRDLFNQLRSVGLNPGNVPSCYQ